MSLELALDRPAAEDRAFTVTEVLELARQTVQRLPAMWVEGEISGFKQWAGGQWYFTLKDRASAMRCVMWGDDARRMREHPADGMKVFAKGSLTVFPRRGQLQFMVRELIPTSQGGPHALKLERARRALERDGLLDPSRKRALPAYPRSVGVVTSPEGAAWTDIVAVVSRRWPLVELVRIGARVQGEEAPRDLVRALALADRCDRLDVVIVARGGGSKEDLWAFNEEAVARAVAASRVPTISAVGHEVDTTLADLVADVRAPTPSAAAEKAVPDRSEVLRHLAALKAHLAQAAGGKVQQASARLALAASRMAGRIARMVQGADHRLRSAALLMSGSTESLLSSRRALADRLGAALEALSPLKVLERGYAVARDETGRVLRRTAELPAGRQFRLRLQDGEVRSRSEGPA